MTDLLRISQPPFSTYSEEKDNAQQLTHAVRDRDGKLQTRADEVHARLEQAWQDEVLWRKKGRSVRGLQRALLVEYAPVH